MGYSADCGKCDGLGKINAFGHVDNGKCFWCYGSGKLTLAGVPPTQREAAASRASWTLDTVAAAIRDGNHDRARFYAIMTAKELIVAGTAHALRVLNADNRFDHDGDRIPRACCRQAAALVITIGKELLADNS